MDYAPIGEAFTSGVLKSLGEMLGLIMNSLLPQASEWRNYFIWQFLEWCVTHPWPGWLGILAILGGIGQPITRSARGALRMIP